MIDTRQHVAYPVQLDANGYLLTVEQESDAEITAAMSTTLLWPLGTRELDPEFGVDEQNFQQGGANLDEIREALEHGEPRALTDITQDDAALADFIASVRVGWDRNTGGAQA